MLRRAGSNPAGGTNLMQPNDIEIDTNVARYGSSNGNHGPKKYDSWIDLLERTDQYLYYRGSIAVFYNHHQSFIHIQAWGRWDWKTFNNFPYMKMTRFSL